MNFVTKNMLYAYRSSVTPTTIKYEIKSKQNEQPYSKHILTVN